MLHYFFFKFFFVPWNVSNVLLEYSAHKNSLVDPTAKTKNKKMAQAMFQKAAKQFDKEDFDGALNYLDQALYKDPNHFDSVFLKAKALAKSDRTEESIGWFDKAISLNSFTSDIYHQKVFALAEMGRYEEANATMDAALAVEPEGNLDNFNNKGYCLILCERFAESLPYFDKALQINSKDHEVMKNKGDSLVKLGRFDEAISVYDKALTLDKNNSDLKQARGLAISQKAQAMSRPQPTFAPQQPYPQVCIICALVLIF